MRGVFGERAEVLGMVEEYPKPAVIVSSSAPPTTAQSSFFGGLKLGLFRSLFSEDSTAQCPMSLKFGAKSDTWNELLRMIQESERVRV